MLAHMVVLVLWRVSYLFYVCLFSDNNLFYQQIKFLTNEIHISIHGKVVYLTCIMFFIHLVNRMQKSAGLSLRVCSTWRFVVIFYLP